MLKWLGVSKMEVVILDDVIRILGKRPLAYAIYSLLVKQEPQILIVDNDEEVKVLDSFLNFIFGDLYGSSTTGLPKLNKPFEIITKDTYMKNWKKFSGERIVFVKEDINLKSEAIDNMISLIDKSLKSKFPPPEDRFKNVIESTLTIINRVVGEIQSRNGDLSDKESYLSIIRNSLVFEEQLQLVLELLRIKGYDLTS